MKQSKRQTFPNADLQELNQVLVSGQIVSQVHVRVNGRYVFTLRNRRGWFYVLWQHPDWRPRQGQQVLVRGSIYSVLGENGNMARIQADEVHSFVRCKQPRVTPEKAAEGFCGDAWTYTALDPDSKLIVTWEIGKRGEDSARRFMKDLAARLLARPQVSTDANTPYLVAVFGGFGQEVDYAQVVKRYGHKPEDKDHFQAPRCIGVSKKVVQGDPDPKHISTSFVERSNLTLRMGSRRFTRKTNGFSKKLENLKYAVALHFFYYNFCRPHMSLNGATPAMAAGKATAVWGLDDILKVSKAN